ncbi:MAG TPA: peptide chain release factor-like protein [Phycisphaerales bacterium]|nr:peptide chain release factor-like protein [Phycisphaerales bacterium]HMP36569.1 peptide chain release factor-like protein [Phycisphaerales bacterium]
MPHRPAHRDPRLILLDPPHPSTIDEDALLKECEIETGRVSGPGGQNRNKVETAVQIRHRPTGVETRATERRSQGQNRSMAIFRLRLKLAVAVRTWADRDHHRPSELWRTRRQGEKLPVNPEHEHYPALLAEALDVVVARGYDVAGAAGLLGITMSQLARLVRHDKRAFALVNDGREERGLPRLK